MRHSYVAVLVASILVMGICSNAAAASCEGDKQSAWDNLVSKMPRDPQDLAQAVESFRKKCGLPFDFWAGPNAAERQAKEDHPCSGVVAEFTRHIPSPSDLVLQPEIVFEFNSAGKVVKQWWLPVDSLVAGISGGELLVPLEVVDYSFQGSRPAAEGAWRVYLTVRSRGRVNVQALRGVREGALIDCPKSKDLPASDAQWCWEFEDMTTGRKRRIAYDGPCT